MKESNLLVLFLIAFTKTHRSFKKSSLFKPAIFSFLLQLPFLLSAQCGPGQTGLYVNEFSQGLTGSEEWIEFLVHGDGSSTFDLNGWIVNDNDVVAGGSGNAAGYIFFNTSGSGCSALSSIPHGSLILFYNDAGSVPAGIPAIDLDDTNPPDGVYVIPASSACVNTCNNGNSSTATSYPCPGPDVVPVSTWIPIAQRNDGDAILIYDPSGTFFYAWDYDLDNAGESFPPNQTISLTGTGTALGSMEMAFFGCGDPTILSNITGNQAASAATPGMPNDPLNTNFIANAQSGNLDCGNYALSCSPPPPSGAATPVPTIGEWGLISLLLVLGSFALASLKVKEEELSF